MKKTIFFVVIIAIFACNNPNEETIDKKNKQIVDTAKQVTKKADSINYDFNIDTSEWPMYVADKIDSIPKDSLSEIKWKFDVIACSFPPACVLNDTAFFAVSQEKYEFCAANVRTGEIYWKFTAESIICGDDNIKIADTILYLATEKILYALSKKTGKVIWKANGENNRLKIYDGKIFSGALNVRDAKTGKLLWSFNTEEYEIEGKNVYILNANNYIYAVDINTGKSKWTYYLGNRKYNLFATNKIVCFIDNNDKRKKITVLNAKDGTLIRYIQVQEDAQAVLTQNPDNLVFIIDKNNVIHAIEPISGKQKWAVKADCNLHSVDNLISFRVMNNNIFVQAMIYKKGIGDILPLFAIDARSGKKKWKISVTDGLIDHLQEYKGLLYSVSYVINPETGVYKKTSLFVDQNFVFYDNMVLFSIYTEDVGDAAQLFAYEYYPAKL